MSRIASVTSALASRVDRALKVIGVPFQLGSRLMQIEADLLNAGGKYRTVSAATVDRISATGADTETDFAKTITVPSGLKVGDEVEIEAWINIVQHNSTNTHRLRLYLGSVCVADTTAVEMADNTTAHIKVTCVVQTAGASGKVTAFVDSMSYAPTTNTGTPKGSIFVDAGDISWAAVNTVKATCAASANSASNKADLRRLTVRVVGCLK